MVHNNAIYQQDCIEFMQKNLDDASIDLIIADPPYNINKDFGTGIAWNSLDDWYLWSQQWLDEAIRILKPTGSIFVYGIHNYLAYLHVYLMEKGMKYRRQIIWHYENNFSGYRNSPAARYEPLLWFSKSDNYTYHKIREPYKSKKRIKNKITKNGKVWKPHPDGKHGGDVWKIPTLAGRRFADEKVDHPTQKPLRLSDKIIKHFSNTGDILYIPFAGSGSECVSAQTLNRIFIATEINPSYLELAKKRLVNSDNQ